MDARPAPAQLSAHVAVQSGDGLVGRFGAAVVVLATASADEFADELLALLDGPDDASAQQLAWQVAELLGRRHESAPAFGIAAPVAEGHLVLLHGAVQAVCGELRLSGRHALTWVDHVLDGPISNLRLTLSEDGDVQPDPRSDLRGGLVRGVGLVLSIAGLVVAERAEQEPAAAEPESPDGAVDADGPTEAVPDLEQQQPPQRMLDNDAQPTEMLAMTPPTAATLISDDGTPTALDRAYVFGREPHLDDAVARGAATGMVVRDAENSISRVHTYLWVNENGVFVRDAHSANGTFVAAPGATDWVRLSEDPAQLPVGWSLRIGHRVFTHLDADRG